LRITGFGPVEHDIKRREIFKKLILVIMVIVLVSMVFASNAYASGGVPVGSCPTVFDLMNYMDGTHQDMPMHIGLAVDLNGNGNGYVCMRVIYHDLHLRVDDTLLAPLINGSSPKQ
jgi:hypothetical protein